MNATLLKSLYECHPPQSSLKGGGKKKYDLSYLELGFSSLQP
jgi:hypothetical protein